MTISDETAAVVLRGITKSFPGVRALSEVDFDCRPGEVHALVGENGSGKSTLIKVASGVLNPDLGDVTIAGQPLTRGINQARRLGLMTAYQDTSLVAELSVADNLSLSFDAIGEGRPEQPEKLLARYDLPFKPSDKVADLGPGARQLLEVARAMCHQPKALMLDEPTAALDMRLAAHLEQLIKHSRDEGTAIVYVSHRLEEVRRLADRLTVLRDGLAQGTYHSGDWDVDDIVELMVGAPTDLEFPNRKPPREGANARLELRDLAGEQFGPMSIAVRAGEIVGVAGAEGNGQRAMLRGLIGIGSTSGTVVVDGKAVRHISPTSSLEAGINFQSGDRAAESIYEPLSVMDNLTMNVDRTHRPFGLVRTKQLRSMFFQASDELGIVSASPYQPISGLSGGNQQKVVLARPSLGTPKVLVVDEPTQGVDARARLDIYRVLAEAAEEGIAVLVNSSDSSELAGLCDRVYVMSRGKVANELASPTTEAEIVRSFVSAAGVEEEAKSDQRRGTFLRRMVSALTSQIAILVLLVLIVGLSAYAGARSEVFWSSQNIANLLLLSLPLGFVALGQQFTLLSGGLDISVGATMSLTVVILSLTLPDLSLGSLIVALPALVATGVVVGLFNAFIIERLKVNAIVATIATMGIVQGVAIVLRPAPGGFIAPDLGTSFALGFAFVPVPFVALLGLALTLEWWLHRTKGGLGVRATGFDSTASNRVGQRVGLHRSAGLVVCALCAVVAGICLAAFTGIGSNDVGASYTLTCFAAAFLGGAVLTGGRGSFVGAFLGALFLSLLDNVTPLLGVADGLKQVLYGAILLVAVTAYVMVDRARSGRWRA
jgi:ribose transport system ATP-binding protein